LRLVLLRAWHLRLGHVVVRWITYRLLRVVMSHVAVDHTPSKRASNRPANKASPETQPSAQHACAQVVVLAGLLVVWVAAKKVVSNPAAYVSATHIFAPRSSQPTGNV
jgi:hypothetical protein